MKILSGDQRMGLTRRNPFLALVTLMPVGLIAYALWASLMAPDTDMLLIVSALLIMGVGGFVIWDALLSPSRSVDLMRHAKIERRAHALRRWPAGE